jgi:hypothetical protein
MMASIIDEAMAREGTLDPDFGGINWAEAGDRQWHRRRGEIERNFLGRVRRDARGAGYRIVHVAGDIEVETVTPLRRSQDGDAA